MYQRLDKTAPASYWCMSTFLIGGFLLATAGFALLFAFLNLYGRELGTLAQLGLFLLLWLTLGALHARRGRHAWAGAWLNLALFVALGAGLAFSQRFNTSEVRQFVPGPGLGRLDSHSIYMRQLLLSLFLTILSGFCLLLYWIAKPGSRLN